MSFWRKSLQRIKNGEKRLEDMTPLDFYLSKVEWVDLGHDVLYAKTDMYPDELFSLNEIRELVFPENISIMKKNHFKWLQDNCKIIKLEDNSIHCVNKNTGEHVQFHIHENGKIMSGIYFINELNPEKDLKFFSGVINVNEVGPTKFPSFLGTTKSMYITKNEEDIKRYNIKLVKLKDEDSNI